MNNIPLDMEKAKKYSFRIRLREVFTDGLFANLKWNLLFILTSLPIVTIGPSMATLSHCTNLLVQNDRVQYGGVKIYFSAFKASFKKTLPLGLAIVAVNAVLCTGLHLYIQMMGENILFVPMVSLSLIGLIAVWAVIIHTMPSVFEDTDFDSFTVTVSDKAVGELVKDGAKTAFTSMKKTLICLVIAAVLVAVQLFYMPVTVPIVLTLGFSIPAQVCAFSHTEPDILDYQVQ